METYLRSSLERRPYTRLRDLHGPIEGILLSREIFDGQIFYIIELENHILVKLIQSPDLCRKMDPVDEGDFVTIEFAGWQTLPGGYRMQKANVQIGRTF